MNRHMWGAVAALGLSALAFGLNAHAGRAGAEIGKPVKAIPLRDVVTGKNLDLNALKGKKAYVGIFIQQNCGTTWTYERQMGDLIKNYKKKGVEVVAIHSSAGESDTDIKGMMEQRNLAMPILDDRQGQAFKNYIGARVSPTFFVVDKNAKLRYVGSYDKFHRAPNYLTDAVDAVLANKKVAVEKTAAFG